MKIKRTNPLYNQHSELLNSKRLNKSSDLIRSIVKDPTKYFQVSVDNISLTVASKPLTIDDFKVLKSFLKKHAPNLKCKRKKLRGKYANQARYCYHIQIRNKGGFLFSIFSKSWDNNIKRKLNEKRRVGEKHKLYHNEVKLSVNPNTFGDDDTEMVVSALKHLWLNDYHDLVSTSNVTEIDVAFDVPDLLTEHVLTTYYHTAGYYSYFNETSSGCMYGKDCCKKIYNKSIEQGGSYLGYDNYTRFESKYRPQKRGDDILFRQAHNQCTYNFRGMKFFDPMLLINMPHDIYDSILNNGLRMTSDSLSGKNKSTLKQRMAKHRLKFSKEARDELSQVSRSAIMHVQDLFDI